MILIADRKKGANGEKAPCAEDGEVACKVLESDHGLDYSTPHRAWLGHCFGACFRRFSGCPAVGNGPAARPHGQPFSLNRRKNGDPARWRARMAREAPARANRGSPPARGSMPEAP